MDAIEIVGKIATLITSLGVIIGAMSKMLDTKLRPLTNQNRMQFRHEIVSFANDLQKGKSKSRDEFNSIFELIDEYEQICKKLGIENHLFKESLSIIDDEYKKLK